MKQFIVGVDISKSTLDICIKPSNVNLTIENGGKGFKVFTKQLLQEQCDKSSLLVLMEHTGKYSMLFESFLRKSGIDYCKLPALEFKRSLGMVRGKDDRVDAQRIAEYGWLRREILKADIYPAEVITRLRQCMSLRAKLVRDRAGYKSRLKEDLATGSVKPNDQEARIQKGLISYLTVQIVKVETEIKVLIKRDPVIKKNHELLVSIKGIGIIIAAYMIAFTNNFTKFKNARKFNCYAGLAPFKNESGTSKKGKSKVSNLACKQAKTLLDRAACCALRYDVEIAAYYKRKTSEGKSKRSCINAIKGKMVARIFAIVKRQTPFVEIRTAA